MKGCNEYEQLLYSIEERGMINPRKLTSMYFPNLGGDDLPTPRMHNYMVGQGRIPSIYAAIELKQMDLHIKVFRRSGSNWKQSVSDRAVIKGIPAGTHGLNRDPEVGLSSSR